MVEVLVALVLAAIAMIGVIALYRAQTNASSFSRRSTEATMLAEDQLERLRLNVGVSAGSGFFDEAGRTVAGPLTGGIFHRQFTATQPTGTYFDLSVTITWIDEGLNKTLTVTGRRNAP